MNEPIIKVEDLWYVYPPNIVALRNINLQIYPGEIVAIIGQNGGGKTTLLKHFNGLLKPTKGRVLIEGRDTRSIPVNKLSSIVGYVFQNPRHQIFASKVYEEVAFAPKNLGLPQEEIDRRVEEALTKTKLREHRDVHPYDLDHGKQKLLAFASVLAMKPKIYCIDEPTTGQDHNGIRMVVDLIKDLKREGATIIMTSHDMKFVSEVAERVIVMSNGTILADEPVNDIFHKIEIMKQAQIKPPQIAQLSYALSKYGVPNTIIRISEMLLFLENALEGK